MAQYRPLHQLEECQDTGPTALHDLPPPRWSLMGEKTSWNSRFTSVSLSVLPKFLQPGGIKHRPIGPTSYLDALRGYAACVVYISHAFNTTQDTWRHQPFLSLLYNGTSMVALFFIISGYVLGYRFLILMRRREFERLIDALASSTFRRYIRLYLSSGIAVLLTLPLVRYRLYNGMIISLYKNGFWEQLGDCIRDVVRFGNPFADIRGWVHPGNFYPKYLGVLWTIPVEYRGSVALFVFCLAVCKLTTRSRMVLTWVVILTCYYWQATYVSEFLAGLWIADLSLSRHPERVQERGGRGAGPNTEAHGRGHGRDFTDTTSPSIQLASTVNRMGRWQPQHSILLSKIGHLILLAVGTILLGQPNHGTNLGIWGTFPWRFLVTFYPSWWDSDGYHIFWFGPGALMVLYALEFYPGTALRKPLHWPISQYIGDLSFGIYAVHVPVVFAVLWHGIHPLRHRYLGDASYLAYLPGVLITTLAVFVVADYFTRIDTKVVRFARWLQVSLFAV